MGGEVESTTNTNPVSCLSVQLELLQLIREELVLYRQQVSDT